MSERLVKIRACVKVTILGLLYPLTIALAILYVIYKTVYKTEKSVRGEVALVTGSGHGLGKEIALGLAAKGCHIAVVDINEEAAISTAKLITQTYSDVKAKAFRVNVAEYHEVKALSKDVEEQLGPVTILVNNAGIMYFSSSANPPPLEIQNMTNTNLVAHFWTVRIFMNKMRELGKGHIVAVSSFGGLLPAHRHLEYTATKFGVNGFMSALRTEFYALNCEFINTTTAFPLFLTTNAMVDDMVNRTGMNTLYPSKSGAEVAEAVVEGILHNDLEVFVPSVAALVYRLIQLLPKAWQAKFLNELIGREMMSKIEF